MYNDRAFKIFAVVLIGAAASLLATLVTVGIAAAPTPFFFAEHVLIGLTIRAAYKSFDGPGWAIPGLRVETQAEAPAAADAVPAAAS